MTVLLPFMDHLIADLESRFTKHAQKVARLQALLPMYISQASYSDIDEALQFYRSDLLNPDIVDEEFARWKRKWADVPLQLRPQNLQACLAPGVCTLSNIHILLQLFATLPLSTCSCERSASALRWLKNYLRCTQTEDWLTPAALIHAHYSEPISAEEVCSLFMHKFLHRFEAPSMFFESPS